jgi:hypothetical protein
MSYGGKCQFSWFSKMRLFIKADLLLIRVGFLEVHGH